MTLAKTVPKARFLGFALSPWGGSKPCQGGEGFFPNAKAAQGWEGVREKRENLRITICHFVSYNTYNCFAYARPGEFLPFFVSLSWVFSFFMKMLIFAEAAKTY